MQSKQRLWVSWQDEKETAQKTQKLAFSELTMSELIN
jgi:hypothetical protein